MIRISYNSSFSNKPDSLVVQSYNFAGKWKYKFEVKNNKAKLVKKSTKKGSKNHWKSKTGLLDSSDLPQSIRNKILNKYEKIEGFEYQKRQTI